jgi:hypothetical protein
MLFVQTSQVCVCTRVRLVVDIGGGGYHKPLGLWYALARARGADAGRVV